MLDVKFIRENPDVLRSSLKSRRSNFDLDLFLGIDQERRTLMQKIEKLRSEQNKINQDIQILIKGKKSPAENIQKSKFLKEEIENLQRLLSDKQKKWEDSYLRIPNICHKSLPVGGATKNQIVKESGGLFKFDFKPKNHIELAERLDIIDFKRSRKISGSNFILMKGVGARLQRALINFMLDLHTNDHGYKEILPPVLVLPDAMQGTGQLPNLQEDMYKLKDDNLFLVPTAEVPVTNIHREEILDESDLPIKYTAYTPCFRREAGSYGKDTRGLMRVHQFDKVELVKFVKPEFSYQELELLLGDASRVLEILKMPYRVVLLATADISFASSKCFDIEIYAPGIDSWLEVSSCSNFEDFQARRANIRYKDIKTGKNLFPHTLNGSGLALPRLVAAILENYQLSCGSVVVPEVLRPYMGNLEKIS